MKNRVTLNVDRSEDYSLDNRIRTATRSDLFVGGGGVDVELSLKSKT